MIPIVFKGEIIFVRLLLPFIAGIGFAFLFEPAVYNNAFALFISFLLFIVAIILWSAYQRFKVYFFKWMPGLIVQLLMCTLAYVLTQHASATPDHEHFTKHADEALVVTISSEPKQTADVLRFEADINQGLQRMAFYPRKGKLLIALKTDQILLQQLKYGDRLLIPSHFTEVDPPFNPFEFNYKGYLANHGIHHQAFINSNQISILERDKGNVVIRYAQQLRLQMVSGFTKFIPGKDAAALASTLILGYRADLSTDIISAYSKTGTMHVLSVSGMHVALVLAILAKLLGFSKQKSRFKLLKAILIVSLIWFYSLLTGFSPSVCRAALMISLLIIGKTINRRTNSYNLIAASALLLLIYNPYFLVDAGFQLSYLAVLGLVYLYPKVYHLLYVKNWLGDQVWSYTALSVAAQTATAPLSLFYFHQFPVYFLLSNLFIVVPVTLVMYAGIIFLFLYLLSAYLPAIVFLLKPLGIALGQSIDWINQGLIYIERLPMASLNFYHYHFSYYLLLFFALFSLMIAFQFKNKGFLFGFLIVLLGLASYTSYAVINRSQNKEITFYSLRKNSAISFRTGNKAYVFTDVSPTSKTFSFSVKPSLDALSSQVNFVNGLANKPVFYQDNILIFSNYRVLIWDSTFNYFNFKKHIAVNAVLLNGNPKIKLKDLTNVVSCDMILIDGTNKDYFIKRWVKEATLLQLNCVVLKKHPAVTIALK